MCGQALILAWSRRAPFRVERVGGFRICLDGSYYWQEIGEASSHRGYQCKLLKLSHN